MVRAGLAAGILPARTALGAESTARGSCQRRALLCIAPIPSMEIRHRLFLARGRWGKG